MSMDFFVEGLEVERMRQYLSLCPPHNRQLCVFTVMFRNEPLGCGILGLDDCM